MKKIFPKPEYEVDEKSLDEGVAIVYNYIAKKIPDGDTGGKLFILDCGGGTTDLASCKYSISKRENWSELNIETDFENGDSKFGGNNITYRILQMLKIKMAAVFERKENLKMEELIAASDEEILNQIDNDDKNKKVLYAEFAEYKFGNEARKVKRNFYYLWQLAEEIKIEFFKSNSVNVEFEKKKKIYVKNPEEYYLYTWQDGKLSRRDNVMEDVEITILEVGHLLLPDLYALLATLLNYYGENELMTYRFKLSGQSCKINKFRDLFKEFVPGKIMRPKGGSENQFAGTDSIALKKYCILGSIEYVRDAMALGEYKPTIKYAPNRRIYDVKNMAGYDEVTLLASTGDIKVRKLPSSTSDAKFLVRNKNAKVEREFIYHFDKTDNRHEFKNIDDIIDLFAAESAHSKEILKKTIGEELNNITLEVKDDKVENIFCLAALESKSGYGFNICQIYVKADGSGKKFWIPTVRPFESYEDENLQTFFNGDK